MAVQRAWRHTTPNLHTHAKCNRVSEREREGEEIGREGQGHTHTHSLTILIFSKFINYTNCDTFFFFQYGSSDWSKFAPRTNACWLHYIVNKMAIKSRVKYVTRAHVNTALNPFVNKFLDYNSAKEIFLEFFSQPSPLSYKSKR